jgi:CysZ protein
MIVTAFLRALPQIALPSVRGVLWRTLALTLLVLAALGAAMWWGLHMAFAWMGQWQPDGLIGALLSAVVIGIGSWVLFRTVAVAVVGLYADRIVAAVEEASYGERHALARVVPVTEGMRVAVRSVLRAIGWNLAALPLYLLLVVTGIGAPLLFLVVNAYLLGRDMAELVEGRHPDLPPFRASERWQVGLVSALLFLPPVVNLFAPIWSVAMAAHMFHGRKTG